MTVARQSWRTVPRQRDPGARCHGIVYGFNTLNPSTGKVGVGYVGQTVQRVGQRERQHRDCQPWSDLIVGEAYVIEQGMWTQVELDERERFHIHRLRPLYNYDENLANPDRIPIPLARRQREVRDRARGVVSPVWVSVGRPAVASRSSWSRGQKRVAWLVALWLVLAVAGLVAAVHWAAVGVVDGAKVGGVGASAVYVVAWINRKPKRKRSNRRSKR